MADDQVLAGYLAALRIAGEPGAAGGAELRRGQFHDVVLLGGTAYRFPRDEISRRALPSRIALLRAVAGASGDGAAGAGEALRAAVPWPVGAVREDLPLGQCHARLRRVRGRPLGRAGAATPGLAGELARALDGLAALGRHPAVRAAAPAADPAYWTRFAGDVRAVLFPLMTGAGRRRAEAELGAVCTVDPMGGALVHGDFGGGNLLWSDGPAGVRLTGVLDWDEAHLGSQADDLASLAATFGWPLAEQVDAIRQQDHSPTIPAARLIEATFALQQALPAARAGDAASLADGLTRYTG